MNFVTSAYISLYVFSGETFDTVIIFSKGVSWSPTGKEPHWMNSAVLLISRILYFCGYNAFKIRLGSKLKYCPRVFPQWELCRNWFSWYQTNKWHFIFRHRQPTLCNDKRTLHQDRRDPCSWEHRAFSCGKSMGKEGETPNEKAGVLGK